MDTDSWIKAASMQLIEAGVASARLDCLILLEDITGKNRSWLLAHPEHTLNKAQVKKLAAYIERRRKHEPLAYIRGYVEFYARRFFVNEHVLVPRPETEIMIELLLTLPGIRRQKPHIIDVGTGSGVLAITAKLELPDATATAVDIDSNCLAVTRRNAEQLQANVDVILSDLLNNIVMHNEADSTPVILLCNLPYVPDSYPINQAAEHEPELALFSGSDGLEHYRTLFTQASALSSPPKYILTESLPSQHEALTAIAASHSFSHTTANGYIQLFSHES